MKAINECVIRYVNAENSTCHCELCNGKFVDMVLAAAGI